MNTQQQDQPDTQNAQYSRPESLHNNSANAGWISTAWRAFRSGPLTGQVGIVIIVAYIIIIFFAPLLAPYGESEVVGNSFLAWSQANLLGTDQLGRDVLSRLLFGTRNTVSLALVSTLIAFFIGSTAGLLAATLGGWVDQVLSRTVDVLMAIPLLIFALLLLTIFGTSLLALISIISVLESTRVFRLSRAVAMDVVTMDYVEVARLRGERLGWLVRKEILPNITPPLVAEFGVRFAFVFLLVSALSFLGLGLQPPTADLGSMVRETASLITFGSITPLLPAASIAILTIAINFVVDWFLHTSDGLINES